MSAPKTVEPRRTLRQGSIQELPSQGFSGPGLQRFLAWGKTITLPIEFTPRPYKKMSPNSTHLYDYSFDLDSDTAGANVVRMVGLNRRVLEIGCGPGSITKILHNHNNCTIVGLELDPEAIPLVEPYCERVIAADLNNIDWPALANDHDKYDTIVAADVLEHLYNPWKTLSSLKALLSPGGEVVISLPHIGHAALAACLMTGSFEYRDWGLLDRTHIRFFGVKDIDKLFSQAGLNITEVAFVKTPPELTEFAPVWATLDNHVQRTLMSYPHWDVYQVVIKAVPGDVSSTSLSVDQLIQSEYATSKLSPRAQQNSSQSIPHKLKSSIKASLKSLLGSSNA